MDQKMQYLFLDPNSRTMRRGLLNNVLHLWAFLPIGLLWHWLYRKEPKIFFENYIFEISRKH